MDRQRRYRRRYLSGQVAWIEPGLQPVWAQWQQSVLGESACQWYWHPPLRRPSEETISGIARDLLKKAGHVRADLVANPLATCRTRSISRAQRTPHMGSFPLARGVENLQETFAIGFYRRPLTGVGYAAFQFVQHAKQFWTRVGIAHCGKGCRHASPMRGRRSVRQMAKHWARSCKKSCPIPRFP